MKMNFCVRLPVTGPMASVESIIRFAQKAEEYGYYGVTTHDHFLLSYERRYHNSGGLADLLDMREKIGLPVTDVFETLSIFNYIAGVTERIKMIPCAIVLPIRNPIILAKQAITLDHLSNGRFICNVCAGAMPSDFIATGVDFNRRGKIMDEYLTVLKQIFSTGEVNYQGKYITLSDIVLSPKPKNLQLWYAGHFKPPSIRRAAKFASGFFPGNLPPEQYKEGMPKFKRKLKKYGRKESDVKAIGHQTFLCMRSDSELARKNIKYTMEAFYHNNKIRMEHAYKNALIGSPDEVIRKLQLYADVGVNTVDIRIVSAGVEDSIQMLNLFSKSVMPTFN